MSENASVTANLGPQHLGAARDTVAQVLEEAKRQGASAAEAQLSLAQGLSVDVRLGEVETVEFHRDRGLAVTVFFGQRKGQASTSDDSPQSLRDAVAAACAIARHTEEDKYAGIASPEQLADRIPDLDLYHPWALSTEQAIDDALRCEAVARDDERIVNSEGASVSTGSSLRVLGTSAGFLQGYAGTMHSRSCAVVAEDDQGMQRNFWYDAGRRADLLASAEQVGERARERTLARLGAEIPDTAELPVLLAPPACSAILFPRSAAAACTGAPPFCATGSVSGCFRGASMCASSRCCRAPTARRRSTATVWRRGTRRSWKTGCCAATRWACTPRGGSTWRPPATAAACTTCRSRIPARISTPWCGASTGVFWSPR